MPLTSLPVLNYKFSDGTQQYPCLELKEGDRDYTLLCLQNRQQIILSFWEKFLEVFNSFNPNDLSTHAFKIKFRIYNYHLTPEDVANLQFETDKKIFELTYEWFENLLKSTTFSVKRSRWESEQKVEGMRKMIDFKCFGMAKEYRHQINKLFLNTILGYQYKFRPTTIDRMAYLLRIDPETLNLLNEGYLKISRG